MSKIMTRAAGKLAGLALLFTLSFLTLPLAAPAFLSAAQAAEPPRPAESVRGSGLVAQTPSETQALVVGGVALAMILGIAAAVMWYTSRHRQPLG